MIFVHSLTLRKGDFMFRHRYAIFDDGYYFCFLLPQDGADCFFTSSFLLLIILVLMVTCIFYVYITISQGIVFSCCILIQVILQIKLMYC